MVMVRESIIQLLVMVPVSRESLSNVELALESVTTGATMGAGSIRALQVMGRQPD